ncbi:MAG: UPF0489 family protein [Halanaerobiales bacterium]|nr:UPF0489 family protein [Halanaerobiales bacterium]
MQIVCMEEHSSGLWNLAKYNVKDATFIHFDAHLDIAYIGQGIIEKIEEAQTPEELRELEEILWYQPSKGFLGFHCGNFLYPAIKKGMIKHFVWVMSNEKRSHVSVFKKIITTLGGVTEEDYFSLTVNDGIIRGKLFGIDFTVLTLNELAKLSFEEEVIIDIDIDYFFDLNSKLPWIELEDFVQRIEPLLNWTELVMICNSVQSGHVPATFSFYTNYLLGLIKGEDVKKHQQEKAKIEEIIRNNSVGSFAYLEKDLKSRSLLMLNSLYQFKEEEIQAVTNELTDSYLKGLLLNFYNPQKALNCFMELESSYKGPRFLLSLGRALIRVSRFSDAVPYFEQVLELEANWMAYFSLGVCYYHLRKCDQAGTFF